MSKIIKSIYINNFRGIESVNISFDNLNIFIGDNGTNKTALLEAINYALTPSIVQNRITPVDFHNGKDEPIKIEIEFENNFTIKIPDGYINRDVECDKISLVIKKRERKSPGKVLSDLVTVDHIVLPKQEPDNNGRWSIRRENGTLFNFDKRMLSFNIFESEEIPRSFYFNKERDKQLQKGFNTSFSSVLEDLNWRYAKKLRDDFNDDLLDLMSNTEKRITSLVNLDSIEVKKIFDDRIQVFGLEPVNFSFINKAAPFEQAILSKNLDKIDLPIKYLGSGIEMIYSLLFLDSLSSLSREKLIILIDEPEIHLHPNLQEKLANYLYDLSTSEKYQIFITTHSPIFFKNLVNKDNVRSMIAKKENENYKMFDYVQTKSIFPWGPTWGEINYFAYDYPTVEFHNELYGYLQEITGKTTSAELDEFLNKNFGIGKNKIWIRERCGISQNREPVTLMTFIRHKIHHPENKTMQSSNFCQDELKMSIEKMIELIHNNENNSDKDYDF